MRNVIRTVVFDLEDFLIRNLIVKKLINVNRLPLLFGLYDQIDKSKTKKPLKVIIIYMYFLNNIQSGCMCFPHQEILSWENPREK